MSDLKKIIRETKSHENKAQAAVLRRFFKTAPGQYGAGDKFLGLYVPLQRSLAHKYAGLPLNEVKVLLNSQIHEFRLMALMILVRRYQQAVSRIEQKKIVDFYLRQTTRINNWDLVDLSAPKILGDYLLDDAQAMKVLGRLAASNNLWERRIAMVSTYAFMKRGRSQEAIAVAEKLLDDKHDLIHKAVGWMLRELGKQVDKKLLLNFLDEYYRTMPRTALRYAIERLSPSERAHYLTK